MNTEASTEALSCRHPSFGLHVAARLGRGGVKFSQKIRSHLLIANTKNKMHDGRDKKYCIGRGYNYHNHQQRTIRYQFQKIQMKIIPSLRTSATKVSTSQLSLYTTWPPTILFTNFQVLLLKISCLVTIYTVGRRILQHNDDTFYCHECTTEQSLSSLHNFPLRLSQTRLRRTSRKILSRFVTYLYPFVNK